MVNRKHLSQNVAFGLFRLLSLSVVGILFAILGFITDKGAILKKYGPDVTDNAQLHIRYTVQNGDITITDKDGKILPYVPQKEWKQQINNALEDTITFSDESFFWEGEWTGGTISDGDYRNGFYQYMNENKDNVFKITSVGGPYTLIPHFEILGK